MILIESKVQCDMCENILPTIGVPKILDHFSILGGNVRHLAESFTYCLPTGWAFFGESGLICNDCAGEFKKKLLAQQRINMENRQKEY